METRTVVHGDPEAPSLKVTVSEATALMGMKHSMLIGDAIVLVKKPEDGKAVFPTDLDELAVYMMRRFNWPNCKAAMVESSGFDHNTLTFEEFCGLPEAFVAQWEKAALELNPHWAIREPNEDEGEKKDDSVSEKTSTETS